MTETPLDPAELSAYLDGELPSARMIQIEALLAKDPALRAEYEALRGMDSAWRETGATAMFVPALRLPTGRAASLGWAAGIVAALLAARIAGKFVEALGPSMMLNLAALVLVAAAVLAAARRDLAPGSN